MAKNNHIQQILQAPDKYISRTRGANGILTRLWIQILSDRGVTLPRWGSLMADYISDARNGIPNNKKDQTSMRGNLTKEFTREQMTWKVFCKGLRFLQVLKIELVIKAYHANGETSLHSTVVDFGGRRAPIVDDPATDEDPIVTEDDEAEATDPTTPQPKG